MSIAVPLTAAVACAPRQHPSTPFPPGQQAAQDAFGPAARGRISVRADADRPRITTVSREGDPSGAVAAVVLTDGGSVPAVALGAVVRARLRKAGVKRADVSADRFGYRVHALIGNETEARAFVESLRQALDQPVTRQSAGAKSVQAALEALRRRPLDASALDPVASCTGELGESHAVPSLDPQTATGAAQLESWRARFHGAQRIAIATVGPAKLGAAVETHLANGPAWPSVAPPADPWPDQNHVGAYALPGAASRAPRLTVAARVGHTFAVSDLAEHAFHADGPLARKLEASTSWRLRRTTATVRPRGACLAITIERDPARKHADLATDAARMAAMIARDIQVEVGHAAADASVAGDRVLRASDPRRAASLAAWWSHAARLEPGPTRFATALGVPPQDANPKDADIDGPVEALQTKLRAALPLATKAWEQPVVDAASRIEAGQGELWLLLASPCGTSAESEADAGFSALAVAAASRAAHGTQDVRVEPWIAQDGIGVLAHAAPRPNETPAALAKRVATVAGEALLGPTPSHRHVTAARSTLLSLIEAPTGPHAEPFGLLAHALVPSHPAWLAPFGLRKAIVEGDPRSIELRLSALSDGPLRVAVLANEDAKQAEVAVRTVDRWVVHRGTEPRTCPPVAPATQQPAEARDFTIQSVDRPPHALLGIAIRSPNERDSLMLDLLREALTGKQGWMTTAFRSFEGPVRVQVRTVGQGHVRALVIELHCADELLDRAVQQARAVLARIRQGAATEAALLRSSRRVSRERLEARLDPRTRIASTWRAEPSSAAVPTLPEWKAWLTRTLPDDRIVIVTVRPPRPAEDDADGNR